MTLMTDWKRLVEIIVSGGGGVLLVLVGISYYQSGLDRARAEAEIESREKLIELQDRTIAAKDKAINARAEETAQAKKELDALRDRPATTQEIIVEIPRFVSMPGMPTLKMLDFKPEASDDALAITNHKPRTPGPRRAGSEITNEGIVFDSAQAQSLRTFYLACAEQKIDLTACQGDLADMKAKAEAERLRADLFKDQRDAALKGLKGGNRWTRFVRNGKMVGVGIVLGVAGGIALTR